VKVVDRRRSGRTSFDDSYCKYEIPQPTLGRNSVGNVKRGAERNPTGSGYVIGTALPTETGDALIVSIFLFKDVFD
jgi:hypothetical protein